MKEYSLTLANQFKALLPLIFVEGFLIVLAIFLYEPTTTSDYYRLFTCISVPFLILLLPGLYLHFQYLKVNKDTILKVDEAQQIIYISKGHSDTIAITKKEIVKIDFYLSYGMYSKRSYRNLPFDDYHYCILLLANKDQFVFTSLLGSDLEIIFEHINVLKDRHLSRYNCLS